MKKEKEFEIKMTGKTVVIKRKDKSSAKRLMKHLEKEHPSTRGKIKVV